MSFYLFRGVSNPCHQLLSSLTRHAQTYAYQHGLEWRQVIQDRERLFLENFTNELLAKQNDFKKQYSWIDEALKGFPNDTYRILSIMQHYGGPTRLLDFTSDPYVALFFAAHEFESQSSPCFAVYRLHCINDDHEDKEGDKAPKDSTGEPFKENNGVANQYNANTFLGRIIRYNPYKDHGWIDLDTDIRWHLPKISFGWDKPAFENPRLSAQNGFFVYNVDVRKAHQEIMSESDRLEKFLIDGTLIADINNLLHSRGINISSLYLDLDKTLERWKR